MELNSEEKKLIANLSNFTGYLQEELCYFYENIPINWSNWKTKFKLIHFKDLVTFAHHYQYNSLHMNEQEMSDFLNFFHRVNAERKIEEKESKKQHRDFVFQGKHIEFQGVIDFALLTIKLIAAVNAGASIALLTFLQTIWDVAEYRSIVLVGLVFFVFGLVLSIGTSLAAYLAQYAWHNESDSDGEMYRKWSIGTGVSAMGCFILGAGYIFCKLLAG